MITADQLKDIKERTEALYRYLGIEQKRVEVEEEELRTQAPDFWEDAKAAEAQMKKELETRTYSVQFETREEGEDGIITP